MRPLYEPRADGSFVILRAGNPYHVLQSDTLFPAVLQAYAEAMAAGVTFPAEPGGITLPGVPMQPTPRQFMDRVSAARQAEITAAAMSNPALLLWLLRMLGASHVDPAHPETVAGVQAMRAAGVISEGEAEALLT